MKVRPGDRKVWSLNEMMMAELGIDELMKEIFPEWTDETVAVEMFDYCENARDTLVEAISYIDATRSVGINDQFAKVIGKGKDVTRQDIVNRFTLIPGFFRPARINLGISRILDAIYDGRKDIINFTFCNKECFDK